MIESGYYPLGAENDSNAPYNEEEQKDREIDIEIVLSKKTKINVNDYKIMERGKDEDGRYYEDIDYSECDLKNAVENQLSLSEKGYILEDVQII